MERKRKKKSKKFIAHRLLLIYLSVITNNKYDDEMKWKILSTNQTINCHMCVCVCVERISNPKQIKTTQTDRQMIEKEKLSKIFIIFFPSILSCKQSCHTNNRKSNFKYFFSFSFFLLQRFSVSSICNF